MKDLKPRYFHGPDYASLEHTCGNKAKFVRMFQTQNGELKVPNVLESFIYCPNKAKTCDGNLITRLHNDNIITIPTGSDYVTLGMLH